MIPNPFPAADLLGEALIACMNVTKELSEAFGVTPVGIFEQETEGSFQARAVLRATFGTSNREKLRKMRPETFLKHYKDFDANLYEAKLARLQHRKPDWREAQPHAREAQLPAWRGAKFQNDAEVF